LLTKVVTPLLEPPPRCSVCIHQLNRVNSHNGYGHDDSIINTITAIGVHRSTTELSMCSGDATFLSHYLLLLDYLLLLLFHRPDDLPNVEPKNATTVLDFIQHGYSEISPPVRL